MERRRCLRVLSNEQNSHLLEGVKPRGNHWHTTFVDEKLPFFASAKIIGSLFSYQTGSLPTGEGIFSFHQKISSFVRNRFYRLCARAARPNGNFGPLPTCPPMGRCHEINWSEQRQAGGWKTDDPRREGGTTPQNTPYFFARAKMTHKSHKKWGRQIEQKEGGENFQKGVGWRKVPGAGGHHKTTRATEPSPRARPPAWGQRFISPGGGLQMRSALNIWKFSMHTRMLL